MTTLHHRSHTDPASGRTLPYLEALPTTPAPTATATGGAPLLLFLHGARDRGDDLGLLLRWAPPRQVAEAAELPFHFIAPQIPAGSTWPDHADALLGLIDHLAGSAGIDPARVLFAGFSLGAAGAWRLASQHPRRFAGLVAVSGRLATDVDLDALATVPVWAFHGGRDEKLPPAEYEPALAQLRARGAAPQHTLYLQGDHFIGERAFAEPVLREWLLSLRAGQAAPAAALA